MKTILKVIDIISQVFLVTFSFIFAFGAICATACLFTGDILAIMAIIAASFLSWICWSLRREIR